jgi:hypothetical protein
LSGIEGGMMNLTMELSKDISTHMAGDVDLIDILRALKWAELAVSNMETEHVYEFRRSIENMRSDIAKFVSQELIPI